MPRPCPTCAPQAAPWDADGTAATSVLVASQLENEAEGQGYTRFVFPCMDEPSYKVRAVSSNVGKAGKEGYHKWQRHTVPSPLLRVG